MRLLKRGLQNIQVLWQWIRRLSGQDAYERYLLHFYAHQADHLTEVASSTEHGGSEACCITQEKKVLPLTKEEFYKQWQDRKWRGINRCC